MLRQGAPAREFRTSAEMRTHYAAVQARLWAGPAPGSPASADAERERAARAAFDARVAEILRPDFLARDPRHIITRTAKAFGFTAADILGPGRSAKLCEARFAAIDAVHRARPDLSNRRLGQAFGGRDHSTIFHALRRNARLGVPQPPAAAGDA